MHELSDKDRHAVLLGFLENKTLNRVWTALNLTENAARFLLEFRGCPRSSFLLE